MQTDLVFSECQIVIILEHIYLGFNPKNELRKEKLLCLRDHAQNFMTQKL